MNTKTEKEFLIAYDSFSDALFRYCYFKTGDRELAKDLVSDTFMKSWDYLSSGKEIENFRPFLYRLANNMVIDWYRKKKALSLDSLAENGFDPPDATADTSQKAEIEQMMKILGNLEQSDQDLIIWRYVEDLPIKDIATLLSENENTISVRLHRALHRLKEQLQ